MVKHGYTTGTNVLLVEKLSTAYTVFTSSDKKQPIYRLLDMLVTLFRNRRQIDYVLIDTFSTKAFYFAALMGAVSKWLHIPYIPILHGGDLPQRARRSPELLNAYLNNAHQVVSPSAYLQHEIQQLGHQNITVIPNIIEVGKYPFKQRQHVRANLLWVRSFAQLYNPEMGIQVLNSLRQQGIDANLCMVGPDKDGSMEACKTLAKQLGVLQYVTFSGRLTQPEWIELSRNYNIFINTTHIDNTPVSIIEAMALGMCIVSTKVGGIPYLLTHNHNALLVNDGDVDAMCDAIMLYLQEPERTVAISASARRTAEQYAWDAVSPLWCQVLQ